MTRKTKRQLKFEAGQKDEKVYALAHKDAAEKMGVAWLHLNKHAVEVLTRFGYDVTDPRVKAVVSLALRAAGDPTFYARHVVGTSISTPPDEIPDV